MSDNKTSIIITAEDRASAALRSVQQNLSGMSAIASRIVPQLSALTGALSVGSLAAFAKSTIDAADGLNDIAQRTGLSVRNLAEWQLALQQNGASMEGMATGMRNLSVYMVEHGDKLRAAGVTAKDARGAFLQLADLFKALPEGPERAALANEIFKKSGQELLPVLLKGSEELQTSAEKSRDYARAMAELAPKADAFNDTLAEIALNLKASSLNVVAPYLDGLNEMARLFNAATQSGSGFKDLLAELNRLAGGGSLSVLELAARGVDLAYLLGYGADASKRTATGRIGGTLALPGANSPAEIDALARARSLIGSGKTGTGGSGADAAAWMTSDMVRMMREEEQLLKRIADEAERRADAEERANQSLIAMTTSGKLQALVEQQDRAAKLLSEGRITFEGYDEIIDQLGGINDKVSEQKNLAKELGMTFTSAFEDAIVGGKKFSEVLQGLLQDILRLVMRKNITEPFANAIGSIDFGKLLSFNATGGVYSGAGISAYSGQIVSRPTIFPFASGIGLMGEAGPEAILPLKRSRDGKLGVEGGGSSMVVNIIEAPGRGGERQQRSEGGVNILDVFVERIKAGIAGDIADGRGAIPAALGNAYGLNRAAGAY